ncbi:hypothetical protein PR048_022413 [Dryococelus australis]|uniref:Uncharacterized protein n=1 Tax=Dryococelus australis TaxID=614101 RepID=A0ABQ9H0X1_9NEOP|nr:hypothetical protein PR048_022413 [Dryococelus australis]
MHAPNMLTVIHKRLAEQQAGSAVKRRASIVPSFSDAKSKKDCGAEFSDDTTAAFVKTNIPLEKVDDPNICEWMNQNIEGG